ncbi:MaoC family dehydratase N-terminal domain-containing protein [Chloroflexota bacterium]
MKVGRQRPVEWPAKLYGGFHGGILHKHVTHDMIRDYAAAIGDPNPLWSDPDYAKNTRWGGIIAPPTFEFCLGFPFDVPEIFPVGGVSLFDAGATIESFQVIRPGDEFTARDIYLGIKEKTRPDRRFRVFLQQNDRMYYNQRGEKVVRIIGGLLLTITPPGEENAVREQVYSKIKRPRYTKKQLDALYRAYDEEMEGKWRQGAKIRYWEDVTVGEEIHPVVKGPLDDFDVMSYEGCTGPTYAFAVKWASIKEMMADNVVVVDPETGVYRHQIEWHHSDTIARVMGIPYALGEGQQNQAVIAHGVTNWMGDDGCVKRLAFQCCGANFFGDMNWIKGRVVRKYVTDGAHLVDLEVLAECQDGRIHTKGIATVRLVPRED